jgi:hypothetical protein
VEGKGAGAVDSAASLFNHVKSSLKIDFFSVKNIAQLEVWQLDIWHSWHSPMSLSAIRGSGGLYLLNSTVPDFRT